MLGANTNRTCVRAVFCAFAFFPQYVLKPTFTKQHIAGLDKQGKLYRAYDGTTYLPGIVGLNNIKANDYANVVLQVQITAARCFSRPGRDIGNCGTSVTYFHRSVGLLQCPAPAELLPGRGKLQGDPQAAGRHHVSAGTEVWGADA